MNVPENLQYTADHEWISITGDVATIGITDFAQHELGDIVFVEMDLVGEQLDQHEVFGTVEAVKTVSDLFLPIGGEVLELNPQLEDNPGLVNSDPYGDGWIIKLKISNAEETKTLLNPPAYKDLIGG
jgi:glycine cleavage system H protein